MKSIDDIRLEYTNIAKNEVRIDVYKNNEFTGFVKCYVMSGKVWDELLKK